MKIRVKLQALAIYFRGHSNKNTGLNVFHISLQGGSILIRIIELPRFTENWQQFFKRLNLADGSYLKFS